METLYRLIHTAMGECCDRWFERESSLIQHWSNSSRHAYCQECDRHFNSDHALRQHLNMSERHRPPPTYKCSLCGQGFYDQGDYRNHLAASHHWCFPCQKSFCSARARESHLNSIVHQDRDKMCPFCGKAFKSFSSIAGHIESSACSRFSVNPTQLCNIIRRWEQNAGMSNTFTKKLLTDGSSRREINYDFESCYDSYYDEYDCPLCNRSFASASNLRAHVYGSAHSQKIYHCANCRKEFTALAGLLIHFETTSCGKAKSSDIAKLARGLKSISF